jgi:hypothetical protein
VRNDSEKIELCFAHAPYRDTVIPRPRAGNPYDSSSSFDMLKLASDSAFANPTKFLPVEPHKMDYPVKPGNDGIG